MVVILVLYVPQIVVVVMMKFCLFRLINDV